MYKSKNPALNLPRELAEQIGQVTEHQIDELILLVCRRFYQLHPEREGMFMTLSIDPAQRKKEVKQIVGYISTLYGITPEE